MAAKIAKEKLQGKGSQMREAKDEEVNQGVKMMASTACGSDRKGGEVNLPMANFPSSKRRRAACLDGGMVVRSGDDVATEEGLGNADGVAESEWQLVANRITSEDVEDLLLCAQRDAELMQGRDSSEACGVSQTSFLNSFEERQGREISNATLSQAQRGRVQQMVELAV